MLYTSMVLGLSLSLLLDAWALEISPSALSFQATQGGANPSSQVVSVFKSSSHMVLWSSHDSANWVSVSPTMGMIGRSTQLSVSVNAAGLATGTYAATVKITTATGGHIAVPVTLTVTAASLPPAISASPASLSFTAQQGSGNPVTQTLSISNTGSGTLSWNASDSAAWLTLSPASGTGNGTVAVSATPGTLAAGSYSSTVTLSATGAAPVTVPVSLTVTAAAVPPSIGASPTTFSFTATQGAANPATQLLNITNPGTGTLSWSITDNANWLALTPASGATTTGTSPVTVSVNTAGLGAGSSTATITIAATGAANTPQTIPVTLRLNTPGMSSATLTWNASTSGGVAGYKVYQSTTSGVYGPPIATLQGNGTSYTATGLAVGTTYFWVVTDYDQAGNESVHSNEVSKSIF
ncbi:MAG TPA: BACON domain-containing carbohydrate-binding protein [Nitrospiraceae bacterium]|nr:BACON domain-containing carbohydrate-binding protein [Nitrospiraceae bacterium]